MTPWSIVAIYFVVWWIVLFAVLPFGVRTQGEAGNVTLGTSSSAPVRPRLIRTAIATTIVAAVVVGGMVLAFDFYGITLETFADLLDAPPAIKKARPFGLAHRVPRLIPSF